MTEGRPAGAGREMILASAGSGKTYRLSSRLIALLAAGVPAEEILASTFTRKAAGEIVERVLVRLARAGLDPEEARALTASVEAWAPARDSSSDGWARLLLDLTRSLHRIQVHTLDAFFHRVVRSFSQELGFPERWTVASASEWERIRMRAIEATLDGMDRGAVLEIVRLVSRGEAGRGVQAMFARELEDLHGLWRELDPGIVDPWGFEGGEGAFVAPEGVDAARLAERFRAVDLPRTRTGEERKDWSRARAQIVAALEEEDWDRLFQGTFPERLVAGPPEFGRVPFPEEVAALGAPLRQAARAALGPRFHRRVVAMGRFLPEFDRRLRHLAREAGRFDFSDLTHALVEGDGLGRREELYYRLDGRIRHILLDEFQDTSTAQWAALEPLVGEILAADEADRSAFLVADPKQSIYGWRGGEPRILDRIEVGYGLEPGTVADNWRSSQIVLDAVNEVFHRIEDHPVLAEVAPIAARWARAFTAHRARRERSGHVRVEAAEKGRTLEAAARAVAALHRAAPGVTIGLLTCTNAHAARLIAILRRDGIEASEEGGVPVADSAPVIGLLALLRMADHPGDRVSSYLVAHTPIGALVGFGPEDRAEPGGAPRVARRLRTRLLREGYGPVVAEWVRALLPGAAPRDRVRLRQFAELANEWESRATLRPIDFVRHVEAARKEDPATAAVRVMTIHRAKGLEFDAVFLPDLDTLSLKGTVKDAFLAVRAGGAGPVTRILPAVPQALEAIFPEVEEAFGQARERELRDGLSTLYVALTRARHAMHIVLAEDPKGSSTAHSAGRVVATTLGPGGSFASGDLLHESGDERWFEAPELRDRALRPFPGSSASRAEEARASLPFRTGPRRRLLPRRAPSALEGAELPTLEALLRPMPRGATARGTVVHAWLEAIEWIEEGIPSTDRLLRIARERAPGLADPEALADVFPAWLEAPAIRALLSRAAHPEGSTVEREVPFLVREGPGLLHGIIDRVVRIPGEDGERLLAIDWKTDAPDAGGEAGLGGLADRHRPQVEAYLRALSASEGVPLPRVRGALAFLRTGDVVQIDPPSTGDRR